MQDKSSRARDARATSPLIGVVAMLGACACSAEAQRDGHATDEAHEHDDAVVVGPATGATCPPVQTLTYANFGQALLDRYCSRCHDSSLSGVERHGAPDDHDFDTLEDVRNLAQHMDQLAGAGPDATNTAMPPSDPRPSLDERRQLSEWLACGAP